MAVTHGLGLPSTHFFVTAKKGSAALLMCGIDSKNKVRHFVFLLTHLGDANIVRLIIALGVLVPSIGTAQRVSQNEPQWAFIPLVGCDHEGDGQP